VLLSYFSINRTGQNDTPLAHLFMTQEDALYCKKGHLPAAQLQIFCTKCCNSNW